MAIADRLTVPTSATTPRSRSRVGGWLVPYGSLIAGCLILLSMVVAAAAAPLLTDIDPTATNTRALNLPPGTTGHPLGTDSLGRDIYARLLYGARVSLSVGLAAGGLSVMLGIFAGAIAGFGPRWLDALIMRLTDVMLALPLLVVVIAVNAILAPGPITIVLVIGAIGWIMVARIVRIQFMVLRESEFVTAASALGASRVRVAVRHILPNALAPVLAIASFEVAAAILTETTLSFLGLGMPPSTPSWGSVLSDGQRGLLLGQWWTVVFPAAAITLSVVAVNLIADHVRLRHRNRR